MMDLQTLTQLATRYQTDVASGSAALPRVVVYERPGVSAIEAMIYEPVICLILQGSKITSIGATEVRLRPGDALLVSHTLPVVSRIVEATAARPYRALILSLDLALVRGLYEQVGEALVAEDGQALTAAPLDDAWGEPLGRYLQLSGRPLDAEVLGPSILREIHYRLLTASIGAMLRQHLVAGSHASRVARALARLRAGFRDPLSVADLADAAGMSASSFHQHFRAVTGTTPLQYLKDLRLIEARTLLATEGRAVSDAAFAVGYESPTHFSRDFSRKFGVPPSRVAA